MPLLRADEFEPAVVAAALGDTALMQISRLTMVGVLALAACAAWAVEGQRPALALEAGDAARGSYNAGVGLAWPWPWRRANDGGEWTGVTELFVSHWSSKVQGGRESRTVVGAVPVFRLRLSGGRPEWFGEGGVGVSYMDGLYRTDEHQFSTQFNFASVLGVGRSFGAHREQALSLRVAHFSNAGIKQPNPGETFLQLRYTHAF